MRSYLDQLSRPGVAGCVVLTILAIGLAGPGDEPLVEISDPAPAARSGQVTVAASDPPATSASPTTDATPTASGGPVATVTASAERVETSAPLVSALPPAPLLVDGDCGTWRTTVERYGMQWQWAESIMWRESRCSHVIADRPSTADLSVGAFQVNFYSRSMATWWTENGWPFDLLAASPEAAVAAAGALHAACGTGPWDRRAGYPCRGDGRLRTPAEMGYTP